MQKITGIFIDENGRETKRWFIVPSEEALKELLAKRGWELAVIKSVEELSEEKAKKLAGKNDDNFRPAPGKKISEMKAICKACGHVYFFGKQDEVKYIGEQMENCGGGMQDAGASMLCCGGCLPAVFIPKSQQIKSVDPNKCPKCGSRAVTKEKVTHIV
ncbi:MAG: hypothetical protein ACOYJW_00835 [Candidatus Omnitrophota bacterium]